MRADDSLPASYFEDMFAGDPDPWSFETSPYEAAKHARTVAALGGRRYASAIEIGCATGVLTALLTPHALQLTAIDVSDTALAKARARLSDVAGVRFERRAFPADAPDGTFDLILLSEVAYYWSDRDLAQMGEWIARTLAPGGDVLLVHWTGETDYPQTADAAVTKLRASIEPTLHPLIEERAEQYRLDLWRRGF